MEEDYGMEIELRFQGEPPPLYELSLVKLKTRGLVRNDAEETDILAAWDDTPGLFDLRRETRVQAGLPPYQTALQTGLDSATVAMDQTANQSGPQTQRNSRGRGGRRSARETNNPGRQYDSANQEGRSSRGRGTSRGRGGRFHKESSIDEMRLQLARLLSDNIGLREQLAEEKRLRESSAQELSYPTIYPGVEEGSEEYTQEIGEIILTGTAEERKAGLQGTGNSSKRAKIVPNGERSRS